MASKFKKAAPRQRKGSSKKQRKSRSAFQRFAISFTTTATTVFTLVSGVLHPQWVDTLIHPPFLSQLGWPRLGHRAPSGPVATNATVARFAQCPQFFPQGPLPQLPAGQHLRELCFSAFAVLHNGQTKTPLLVVERLNRAMLVQAQKLQRTDKFYAEARLPRAERAELEDYRGSGYSRGHLAPAANMSTLEAMAQSFSLANMVPQNQTHNAGAWSKVEQDTRKYVMRAAGDVFVYTGALFDGVLGTVGQGKVAVPSELFKLVYDATTGKAWAHVQANRAETRAGAPLRYADFVQHTGLHLLSSDLLRP